MRAMLNRPSLTQTFHRARPAEDDSSTMASKPAPGNVFVPLRMRSETGLVIVEIDQVTATIGRHSEADVRLPAADISRRHCQVSFEDDVWCVRDLSSLNGIFVNGERGDAAPLYIGDRLRLGTITFIIERAATPKAARSQTLQSIARAFDEV